MISKFFAFFLSVLCVFAVPAFAGYSIIIVPQQAEYITVNGPYGPETWDAPLVYPLLPPTVGTLVCQPDNYNQAAAEPARRTRIYTDSAGTAVSADLFAACPQIRAAKEREIRSGGSKRLLALAAPYSAEERESWPQQKEEAQEFQLDQLCNCPMIRNMASTRGIGVDLMAAKILENADLFKTIAGQILGLQQRLLDRIEAETDFATLLAISWEAQ